MANLATKAPNFTHENAKLMAFKSLVVRRDNSKREKAAYQAGYEAALNLKPANDEARRQRTLSQIDQLDERIRAALDDDDEPRFLELSKAKERLWKLVQPTAGVLKQSRSRRDLQPLEPVPAQENLQQIKDSSENQSNPVKTDSNYT